MSHSHEEDHTFLSLLKACAKKKDIQRGSWLHSEILRRGFLERNPYLGSSLISMYAKCGVLTKAQQVHDELRVRTIVSWNALISGYAQQGQGLESLKCYEKMRKEGLPPDSITFTCILNACSRIGALERGKAIHREIVNMGLLDKNVVLGNALVDMYAKCGMLCKAEQVHDELCHQSVASWNALIAGYAQDGRGHEALACFERMQSEDVSPDVVTFTCILKACGDTKSIDKGKEIHDVIVRKGFLERNSVLGNALVNMYAKCGVLVKALQVLEELPIRNAITWSSIISGYTEHGQGNEALYCFERMQSEGISPNAITFTCIVKACGSIGAIEKGKEIYDEIVRSDLLRKDMVLGSALVDMYGKCGIIAKAQEVHDELHVRNIVSWSALISGYVEHGKIHEAFNCFEQIQHEGLSANVFTFSCILKACGDIGAIEKGKQIHDEIVRRGLSAINITLGNALVDMYAKCGVLIESQQALEELYIRNVVSWSALISGYAQQGQGHEALKCFKRMQSEGLSPDEITFICMLKACASIGAINKGKEIHVDIITRGLLEKDTVLGTALVDMYAKCGVLSKSKQVFEELPIRNIGSWSALMSGYAQQGQGHKALNCFRRMQDEGLSPDAITFLCVLNACSHSGLLDEAQMYFGRMNERYGIRPNLEHHTCMVVVFGYAGLFEKAISVIHTMPCSDYSSVWLALLAACRKWGNVKVGRFAFDHIIQLDDGCPTAYVFMADIYASSGLQEDVQKIEAMRSEIISLKNNVNSFSMHFEGLC